MPEIDFLTLYKRRLDSDPECALQVPEPIRVATVPYSVHVPMSNSKAVGWMEVVVPDLNLVIPLYGQWETHLLHDRIDEYCGEVGIERVIDVRLCMVRYTSPGGRRRWRNDRILWTLKFASEGDQIIMKLVFPELR